MAGALHELLHHARTPRRAQTPVGERPVQELGGEGVVARLLRELADAAPSLTAESRSLLHGPPELVKPTSGSRYFLVYLNVY